MHGLILLTAACDQGLIVLGCDWLLVHSFFDVFLNQLGYSKLGCRCCTLEVYELRSNLEQIRSDGCCVCACKVYSGFGKKTNGRIEAIRNEMIHGAHLGVAAERDCFLDGCSQS